MELLKQATLEVLAVFVTLCVPVITRYLKIYLESKAEAYKAKTDSTIKTNLIDELEKAIEDSVTYVSQTFVDSLKSTNSFTKENQKIAFTMAIDNVLSTVSQAAVDFIEESYGDVNNWISTKIEATVNRQKKN